MAHRNTVLAPIHVVERTARPLSWMSAELPFLAIGVEGKTIAEADDIERCWHHDLKLGFLSDPQGQGVGEGAGFVDCRAETVGAQHLKAVPHLERPKAAGKGLVRGRTARALPRQALSIPASSKRPR